MLEGLHKRAKVRVQQNLGREKVGFRAMHLVVLLSVIQFAISFEGLEIR